MHYANFCYNTPGTQRSTDPSQELKSWKRTKQLKLKEKKLGFVPIKIY